MTKNRDDEKRNNRAAFVATFTGGEPHSGVWCDRCDTPSAVTVPVTLDGSGAEVGRVTVCPRCAETTQTP